MIDGKKDLLARFRENQRATGAVSFDSEAEMLSLSPLEQTLNEGNIFAYRILGKQFSYC